MFKRREVLATIGIGMFAGCLSGSSAYDDWDFEEREAEAWENIKSGYDIAESHYNGGDVDLEQARDLFVEAREAYDVLGDEVTEIDVSNPLVVNDYFINMHGAATSGRNAILSPLEGDAPGGNDFEGHFYGIITSLQDAAVVLEEQDDLRDAVGRDPDELTEGTVTPPAQREINQEIAEELAGWLDAEFGLYGLDEDDRGWEVNRDTFYVDILAIGNRNEEIGVPAGLYSEVVEDGFELNAFVDVVDPADGTIEYTYEIEREWAVEWNQGEIDEFEYVERIEETVI